MLLSDARVCREGGYSQCCCLMVGFAGKVVMASVAV